jgi:UDP:flavonoid glycosyltransferase YjiC (YdhE family)
MRFLFCSLASPGMLHPHIGLALALRNRGHGVAFVTGPSMAGLLERRGLVRIPRNDKDGDSFRPELSSHPVEMTRQVKHIDYALRRFPADVLVGQQLTLGPLIASELRGVPLAVLGLAAYLWPTGTPFESPAHEKFIQGRYEAFSKSYLLTRYMFGLPPLEAADTARSLQGDLFLLRSVAELEGPVATLPPRVHLVGDLPWEAGEEDAELRRWLGEAAAAGEPVLYAQPGRVLDVPGFWRSLVAALEGQPVRVVASVGRPEELPGRAPANFLVRPQVAPEQVLPHARAVLCSSTTAGVLGALTHGKPLLLVPGGGGAELEDLRWRCARAGAALSLDTPGMTPESLRARVRELLESDALRQRAEALRQALARAGGMARAVELLERLAERRGPVPREDTGRATGALALAAS